MLQYKFSKLILLIVAMGLLLFGLTGCIHEDENIDYIITTLEGDSIVCAHFRWSESRRQCWRDGRNVFPPAKTFTVTQTVRKVGGS